MGGGSPAGPLPQQNNPMRGDNHVPKSYLDHRLASIAGLPRG